MKIRKLAAAVACMLFLPCMGAHAEEYGYRVRFCPGGQGVFAADAASCVTVHGADGQEDASFAAQLSDGSVVVSDVPYGALVRFDAQTAVEVTDDMYYIRGIRMAGRDNDDLVSPALRVTEDRDYVVSYGILRDGGARYSVSYMDAVTGEELLPGRTYSGNVGDRPTVSFLYVDGYWPEAYNLARTLTGDPETDRFVFRYYRAPEKGALDGSGGDSAGTMGAEGTTEGSFGYDAVEPVSGGTDAGAGGDPVTVFGGGGPDETFGGNASGSDEGFAADPGGDADGTDPGTADGSGVNPEGMDAGVPEGPADVLVLDEEVPMDAWNGNAVGNRRFLSGVAAGCILFAVLLFFAWKRRKKEETDRPGE